MGAFLLLGQLSFREEMFGALWERKIRGKKGKQFENVYEKFEQKFLEDL